MTDQNPCCDEYRGTSRRGFLRGSLVARRRRRPDRRPRRRVHPDLVRRRRRRRPGARRAVHARRLRRTEPRRPARRPGVLPGPAQDRGPVRPAAGQGRHVRPAPRAGPAGPAVERREDGSGARHRAAGPEPEPLLRDGGGRGRRPRLPGAGRLAQPARRARRRGVAAGGHPDGRGSADRPPCPGRSRSWSPRASARSGSPDPAGPPRKPRAAGRCRPRGAASAGDLGTGLRSALAVVDDFAPVHASPPTSRRTARSTRNNDLADGAAGRRPGRSARTSAPRSSPWTTARGTTTPTSAPPRAATSRRRTDEFAGAIAAFFADLGPLADKVTLVTISEFGRRVVENANQGLDHGHGNVMFVMGAGVKGGCYYGKWPGLTQHHGRGPAGHHRLPQRAERGHRVPVRRLPRRDLPGLTPEPVGVMAAV